MRIAVRTDTKTRRTNIRHRLALIALLATLTTGCGSGSQKGNPVTTQPGMKPTITITEANKRSQDYLDQATNAVFPPPITKTPGTPEERGECTDPDDHGPTNRLQASREYQLAGITPADVPRYFDALRQWWQSHGFTQAFDKGTGGGRLLDGESPSDGFRMSLQSNDVGGLYLTVASPCVWPNGTPEPKN
jgi:hypothetical protein